MRGRLEIEKHTASMLLPDFLEAAAHILTTSIQQGRQAQAELARQLATQRNPA